MKEPPAMSKGGNQRKDDTMNMLQPTTQIIAIILNTLRVTLGNVGAGGRNIKVYSPLSCSKVYLSEL